MVEHFHGKEGVAGSSPAPGFRVSDARLVIREGEGAGGEFPLEGEVVLGREPSSADLVLDDPGVSRRHAAIRRLGGPVTVEDLGSSNGTYVNAQRVHGEVELADGDEIQVGETVLSLHGGDAATARMGAGVPPTADHPGAGRAEPPPARGQPRVAPRRLAPPPDEEGNIPALAAVFLGPLSIFLLLFSTGAAFFVSLPCAIGAIVLGSLGIRRADRGDRHRGLARVGRACGLIGAILSVLALVAFILVSALLDVTEDSLDGIVETIREEIEGGVPDAPDLDGSGGTDAP